MSDTYTWLNSAKTTVIAVVGGVTKFIPADPLNTDYAWLLSQGLVISPYVAPPPPVPESISRRQFFQALALPLPWDATKTTITQQDGMAAMQTGAIPTALQTLVSGLPAAQQFGASMMITGNNTFERHNPLVITLGSAFGWTPAQIDTFWTAASLL
jgi:hypothetical protein